MVALTREAILEADDLKRTKVSVPEWGGHVFVRELTGAEFEKFQEDDRASRPGGRFGYLAAVACVDEDGVQLFKINDAPALSRKSGPALNRLVEAAAEVNGIDDDVEELAGNFEPTQNGDSG